MTSINTSEIRVKNAPEKLNTFQKDLHNSFFDKTVLIVWLNKLWQKMEKQKYFC